MANAYSADDLLEFLDHAGARGLMPATTAQALVVAARNVFGVLSEEEKKDLSQQDIDSVIKRFNNKRAKDFNPSSLREYGRRVHRAVDLFQKWREDPSTFTIKTRTTKGGRKKGKSFESVSESRNGILESNEAVWQSAPDTYQSSIPVRPGVVVTIANVPHDLSKAEAERLANFIRMLAIESRLD